ncbi:PIG-L family deacetylase [Thermoactinomyces daqus]|uniref:PIG-L family deacetylase n=1 Tax=Thermoactinomyces daqus TaxID=1329516 RepID=A0A7W2AHR7_9BACL|nr:PIG-L family deacetylase [Thermoactinomyces daqus]MBA4542009.1 PIG-L family deacetylase [Thermoactinomyces daqus]
MINVRDAIRCAYKAALASVALTFSAMIYAHDPAQVHAAGTPVVYLVPHADDETLSMSIDIRNRIHEGRPVILVLASDGKHSKAREVANGQYDAESYNAPTSGAVYCHYHKRYHNPIAEHYADGYLTMTKFAQTRIDDFIRVAGGAYGTPSSRIYIEHLPNDGFTYSDVHALIAKYHALYPTADIRTTSWGDVHADHAMLGRVLHDMKVNGELGNVGTVYFWSIASRMADATPPRTLYHGVLTDPSYDWWYIEKAITYYKTFDPAHGRYANGYHSVPTQFDYFESKRDIYYHYN